MEKKSQKRKHIDDLPAAPLTLKKPKTTKHVRHTLAETGITLQKGVTIVKNHIHGVARARKIMMQKSAF